MYDNTLFFRELAGTRSSVLADLGLKGKPYVLATVHRPSNTDVTENLKAIISALHGIAREHEIPVILPLHPRTADILEKVEKSKELVINDPSDLVRMIPAVSFLDMIGLEASASVILTDSGGVQKEAWFMEKPVVVLREETEWVEIIEAGNGKLTGASADLIMRSTREYLESPPQSYPPIFGDGNAAREILKVLTSVQWR
jgi:UDP-GlcNAc3NAcA epimerase